MKHTPQRELFGCSSTPLARDSPQFISGNLNHYTDSKIAAKIYQYWLGQLTSVRPYTGA